MIPNHYLVGSSHAKVEGEGRLKKSNKSKDGSRDPTRDSSGWPGMNESAHGGKRSDIRRTTQSVKHASDLRDEEHVHETTDAQNA